MDEEAYAGDDEKHDERELVENEAEIDVKGADVDPGAEGFDVGQWNVNPTRGTARDRRACWRNKWIEG